MRSYKRYITPYLSNAIEIEIEQSYIEKIQKLIRSIVAVKKREFIHIIDGDKESKRFLTGLSGEAAVEKLLGIKIIDFSAGDSKRYDHPDIKGYNVGIKTVEAGKFPVIHKKNITHQIICIKDIENPRKIYICGLATIEVLNEYQDDELILNPELRGRNVKTGFWGFEHLKRIETLEDISEYKI